MKFITLTAAVSQSGLGHSTDENKTYFGSPAMEDRERFKEMASIRLIPDIIEKLDKLHE